MRRFAMVLVVLIAAGSAWAADPPAFINYQGVLRDSSGAPLDGTYSLRFRFFDDPTSGSLLVKDYHNSVTVSGGLLNVAVGSGTIGAGIYTDLESVFANESEVWLTIQVNGESLSPRLRVVSAPYALNANSLAGRGAGEFLDTSSTTQTKMGPLSVNASSAEDEIGIQGRGDHSGGYFRDTNSNGYSYVGRDDHGIKAYGGEMGGYFGVVGGSGFARVAHADRGIEGHGNETGGYFEDADGSGFAYAGYGERGIEAQGNEMGGFFADYDDSGLVRVGVGDTGIEAVGSYAAGYFEDTVGIDSNAYLARDGVGIEAYGTHWGGRFTTNGSGSAALATDDIGIMASGTDYAAYFYHPSLSGTWARIADSGQRGIEASGGECGGWFEDSTSGTYTTVAHSGYKILSTGTSAFVQNHPERQDEVVVYAAPEGDEVATYTRGSARLTDGKARVALGQTFEWVTNPSIGLTAYVSPREDCNGLYVESVTTSELIVRELNRGTSDVSFDFIVWGLRVGFEEIPIVQEKTQEAYIPLAEATQVYERRPELRGYAALERFKAMRTSRGESAEVDMGAAVALKNAIGQFDPEIHRREPPHRPDAFEGASRLQEDVTEEPDSAHRESPPTAESPHVARPAWAPTDGEGNVYGRSFRPSASDIATLVRVAGPVETGDVLTIGFEPDGVMTLATTAADIRVLGIVAGEPGVVLGAAPPQAATAGAAGPAEDTDEQTLGATEPAAGTQAAHVPVALSGMALCKVDAGYGSIRPGDLLTTSPTPGHAMRADEPHPGTILGKALEALDAETGLIKVLVMLR